MEVHHVSVTDGQVWDTGSKIVRSWTKQIEGHRQPSRSMLTVAIETEVRAIAS